MDNPNSLGNNYSHVHPRIDQPSSPLSRQVYKLWKAINRRIAYEEGYSSELSFEGGAEFELYKISLRICEVNYLVQNSIHIKDIYGSDYHLTIMAKDHGFSLSARHVVVTIRNGVIDEPGDMVFATHHTLDASPEGQVTRDIEDCSIEHAFERGVIMVNELIDRSDNSPEENPEYTRSLRHLPYVDAGTLSYTAGIVGSALFMALSIGPGWLGFFISYVPISILTTLAAAAHE